MGSDAVSWVYPVAVLVALLACGPPEVTASDRERLAKQCEMGVGVRNPVEEAKTLTLLDAAHCKRALTGSQKCPDWRARIVGICYKKDTSIEYFKVVTTSLRHETDLRESICDAMRLSISKTASIS
ncbi:MAG TPA: hypothetical protein PKD61_14315, partial [Polyangiaceae bacterium]|nr:hypothetical protein [Polyangiaceae bacterium]